MMHRYSVPIMKRQTGEQIIVDVECAHPVEAQVQALYDTFRVYGWRRIEASLASIKQKQKAA